MTPFDPIGPLYAYEAAIILGIVVIAAWVVMAARLKLARTRLRDLEGSL